MAARWAILALGHVKAGAGGAGQTPYAAAASAGASRRSAAFAGAISANSWGCSQISWRQPAKRAASYDLLATRGV
jgi:hypothetical protein